MSTRRGRYLGQKTLSPSPADFLEILGTSTSWTSKGLSRPVQGQFYLLPLRHPDDGQKSDRNMSVVNKNKYLNIFASVHLLVSAKKKKKKKKTNALHANTTLFYPMNKRLSYSQGISTALKSSPFGLCYVNRNS